MRIRYFGKTTYFSLVAILFYGLVFAPAIQAENGGGHGSSSQSAYDDPNKGDSHDARNGNTLTASNLRKAFLSNLDTVTASKETAFHPGCMLLLTKALLGFVLCGTNNPGLEAVSERNALQAQKLILQNGGVTITFDSVMQFEALADDKFVNQVVEVALKSSQFPKFKWPVLASLAGKGRARRILDTLYDLIFGAKPEVNPPPFSLVQNQSKDYLDYYRLLEAPEGGVLSSGTRTGTYTEWAGELKEDILDLVHQQYITVIDQNYSRDEIKDKLYQEGVITLIRTDPNTGNVTATASFWPNNTENGIPAMETEKFAEYLKKLQHQQYIREIGKLASTEMSDYMALMADIAKSMEATFESQPKTVFVVECADPHKKMYIRLGFDEPVKPTTATIDNQKLEDSHLFIMDSKAFEKAKENSALMQRYLKKAKKAS